MQGPGTYPLRGGPGVHRPRHGTLGADPVPQAPLSQERPARERGPRGLQLTLSLLKAKASFASELTHSRPVGPNHPGQEDPGRGPTRKGREHWWASGGWNTSGATSPPAGTHRRQARGRRGTGWEYSRRYGRSCRPGQPASREARTQVSSIPAENTGFSCLKLPPASESNQVQLVFKKHSNTHPDWENVCSC